MKIKYVCISKKVQKKSPMGMKIHFNIRKMEEILPNFWKFFKKLELFVH